MEAITLEFGAILSRHRQTFGLLEADCYEARRLRFTQNFVAADLNHMARERSTSIPLQTISDLDGRQSMGESSPLPGNQE